MPKKGKTEELREPQSQELPGSEKKMKPEPVFDNPEVRGSGKLKSKIALISGGDSGIGRAVAVLFAKEGANVAIIYLSEDEDAKTTQKAVEQYGGKCLLLRGDISTEKFCIKAVASTVKEYGQLDVLVNNAAVQFPQKNLEDITTEQLTKTFQTNIFSMFWLTKAALPHLKKGASIINTSSVTAYRGSGGLLDYSSTKGAILGFTRSLSGNLVEKGIRVNAVAPGPIWTPLIPATFDEKKTAEFGSDVPMKRAGEPVEVAPCYLYLACNTDSSYVTGQVLHPNGGEIING